MLLFPAINIPLLKELESICWFFARLTLISPARCCWSRLRARDCVHLARYPFGKSALIKVEVVAPFDELDLRVTAERMERVAQQIDGFFQMKGINSADDDMKLAAKFRSEL